MTSFIQVSLECPRKKVKGFSELLTQFGAEAITSQDAADEPILEPKLGTQPLWSKTKVVGLFTADVSIQPITTKLEQVGGLNIAVSPLEDKDWTLEWMKHFTAMEIAPDFWVCPTWQDTPLPDVSKIALKLTPGMAFGTGTHPTTSLCLKWLNENRPHQKTVIDYGCGSGILSIAALLLGAKKVTAVDYDPQAITATKNNAIENQVDSQLEVYLPKDFDLQMNDSHQPIQVDVIVANILAEPLIELADKISSHLKSGGHLVLSGLIQTQIDKVKAAYPEVTFHEPTLDQEWVRLDGIKK